MIVWIILLIIIGSIILSINTFISHRRKIRRAANYSLFLIGNPTSLSLDLINQLYQRFNHSGFVLSFEKLSRGQKEALVIFAPGFLIRPFSLPLRLTEIEDYSHSLLTHLEQPFSNLLALHLEPLGMSKELLGQAINEYHQSISLLDDEQIWWQLVLKPENVSNQFQFNLRLIIDSQDHQKTQELYQKFLGVTENLGLNFHPQPHSKFQLINFYLDRLLILESRIKFFKRLNFYPAESLRNVESSTVIKSGGSLSSKEISQILLN